MSVVLFYFIFVGFIGGNVSAQSSNETDCPAYKGSDLTNHTFVSFSFKTDRSPFSDISVYLPDVYQVWLL